MLRPFLTPKWLARHVLAVAAAATCIRLGIWQWDVYHRIGGGFQNLGYALQWPLFGVAALWLWLRLLRWELHPPQRPAALTEARLTKGPVTPGPITPTPPAASDGAPHGTADDAHARYNRYLRSLAEQDERR